ncbi:reverse transcriptase zinc-binding domain-containing protein [Artemisia annua]|uniref:Reverse transcriptase zinc-binding domain-containing protein n=1 Tax=Artemisia annua TaxID=35608 RepID=A0A2U1L954_ARTAN|nr:reverse transcriptase zinc-binding domain-containing protein [Artemisia annua]
MEMGLVSTHQKWQGVGRIQWANGSTFRPTRWSSLIPSKVLIFVWRAERNRIPTRVELDLKGIDIPSILCPICDNELETVDHILAKCDWKILKIYENFGNIEKS